MSELARRLRDLSAHKHLDLSIGDEAADHIERLEAALRETEAYVTNERDQYHQLIEKGKGDHGQPGYVRDDTWASWSAKYHMAEGILRAFSQIRRAREALEEG